MKWGVRAVAVALLSWGLVWVFSPAVDGFHIGYNLATDNTCESRLFDWCKAEAAPADSPPGVGFSPSTETSSTSTSSGASTNPDAGALPVPAPAPVICPKGSTPTPGGLCHDGRHLPCPRGYTGWQNTQIDNCRSEPTPIQPIQPIQH